MSKDELERHRLKSGLLWILKELRIMTLEELWGDSLEDWRNK